MLEKTHWGQEVNDITDLLQGGIYFLYHNDEIVYIGSTYSLIQRIGQHLDQHKMVFNRVGVMFEEDQLERKHVEIMLIDKHKPKHNRKSAPFNFSTKRTGSNRRVIVKYEQSTSLIDQDFDDL